MSDTKPNLSRLLEEVQQARETFLAALDGISPNQASFKPAPDVWSIVEIVEHITLAEQVGVGGIWKALEAHQRGETLWSGEITHAGLSIEEVVAETWEEKVEAPAIAAPRWGGSLAFWAASLGACQPVLEALGRALGGVDLDAVIYPHPISGPLSARQRLEFLRFHLHRHREQVGRQLRSPVQVEPEQLPDD